VPDVAQLAANQRRVEDELAARAEESQQLQVLMANLQQRLADLQQQLNEKDKQLADMQARLARQPTPASEATAAAGSPDAGFQALAVPPVRAPETPVAPSETPWWARWQLAALLLVALLAALLVSRRRKRTADPEDEPLAPEPAVDAVAPVIEPPQPAAPVREAAMSQVARSPMSTDPLEGANIYIAYGRFGEARVALRRALQQSPQRMDLRLRLMEVLAELGDVAAFAQEEQEIRQLGGESEQIDQIKARYPAMRSSDDSREPMLDSSAAAQEEGSASLLDVGEEFQLNLDDLSLDTDWALSNPFDSAKPRREGPAQEADEVEADFHSNLEELPEVLELDDPLEPTRPMPVAESDSLPDEFFHDLGGLDAPLEHDLDHLAGDREHVTKLNLALSYIKQGKIESACSILNEVIDEGDDQAREEARELLARIA
jgi:pilus assembly protein FimV